MTLLDDDIPLASPPSPTWKFWGTLAWALGIVAFSFLVSLVLGGIVLGILLLLKVVSLEQIQFFAERPNSLVLVGATLLYNALICSFVIVAIKFKAGATIKDYLALYKPRLVSVLKWVGLYAACFMAFNILLGLVLQALGITTDLFADKQSRDMMTSMLDIPLWLSVVLIVISAPVTEELVFRGFIFRGFSESFLGVWGAIAVTSAAWAAVHMQYSPIGVSIIFAFGVLLGYARQRSGTLYIPMILHAIHNTVALIAWQFMLRGV